MQLYECWSKVVGYWNAAEGQYAVPDMMDSHTAVFRYDIWDTEADSGEGMVTELQASGEQELTALVYYAALESLYVCWEYFTGSLSDLYRQYFWCRMKC